MHSYHGEKANFHYHGDFSGEVHINSKGINEKGNRLFDIRIESSDLISLVLDSYEESDHLVIFESPNYALEVQQNFKGNLIYTNKKTSEKVELWAEDINNLVSYRYLRDKMISNLEQMKPKELVIAFRSCQNEMRDTQRNL